LPVVDDALIGLIFREESGRSVATLIRIFGDIDLAEDAVQEAFALALRKWPLEACRRTRAPGSRRPHATARSTTSDARREVVS
jgi:predicted RNA polymerase sigma factor